jgi:hypothetical protein
MRTTQSSVITDTHVPVRSTAAAALAVGGGPAGPCPRWASADAGARHNSTTNVRIVRIVRIVRVVRIVPIVRVVRIVPIARSVPLMNGPNGSNEPNGPNVG